MLKIWNLAPFIFERDQFISRSRKWTWFLWNAPYNEPLNYNEARKNWRLQRKKHGIVESTVYSSHHTSRLESGRCDLRYWVTRCSARSTLAIAINSIACHGLLLAIMALGIVEWYGSFTTAPWHTWIPIQFNLRSSRKWEWFPNIIY